jgi:hypothetical protein
MSISIDLKETENSFIKKMSGALTPLLNKSIYKNKQKVINKVRQFILNQIRMQPEVNELINGTGPMSLNAMLGITAAQGSDAVNEIIQIITNSVAINVKNFDRNLNGGIDLVFTNIDMESISTIPYGYVATLSGNLPWLHWLLMRGPSPIIIGFRYKADTRGRTGGGIMIPGGVFRIPLAYSGTADDNFITRALVGKEQENEITRIFQEIL